MKLIALFLLLAGWILVLSSLVLLRSAVAQNMFVVAGVAVELLGLVMLFRAHLQLRKEHS